MSFFIFLLSVMIFLIIITVITTIIKLSLLVTTKYKYETYILIIPAILYAILWGGLIVLWFILSNRFGEADIFTLFIDSIFESSFNIAKFKPFLLSGIGCCLAGILVQPFVFLTVNIPYNQIRLKIKNIFIKFKSFFMTKVLKKDPATVSMPVNGVSIKEKWVKLKFLNALISSIFSFAVIIIVVLVLIITSQTISKKILHHSTSDKDEIQNETIDTENQEVEQ